MKRIVCIITFIAGCVTLCAQNSLQNVLQQIEANNIALKALRQENEAQKMENRSGIALPDPEVEFGYNWGSAEAGDKIEVGVTQSFDIAIIAGMKSKTAKEQNKLADLRYQTERRQILLQAKNLCLDLVYYNALLESLSLRRKHAVSLMEVQQKRLENGECSQREYNDVVLRMASLEGAFTEMENGRMMTLTRLKAMNGGNEPEFTATAYDPIEMPEDFEMWFERSSSKNPELFYAEQSVIVQKKQLSLSKAQWAPSFSLGYAGEFEDEGNHHGIAVGISVPLWGNLHQVKQAKASFQAAQYRQEDIQQQFKSELQILYQQTVGLKRISEIYRSAIKNSDNLNLLRTSLDAGEISILDFLLETEIYYGALQQSLSAEKDYQQSYAELSSFEL